MKSTSSSHASSKYASSFNQAQGNITGSDMIGACITGLDMIGACITGLDMIGA